MTTMAQMKKTKVLKVGVGIALDKNRVKDIDSLCSGRNLSRSTLINVLLNSMFDSHYSEIQDYLNDLDLNHPRKKESRL